MSALYLFIYLRAPVGSQKIQLGLIRDDLGELDDNERKRNKKEKKGKKKIPQQNEIQENGEDELRLAKKTSGQNEKGETQADRTANKEKEEENEDEQQSIAYDRTTDTMKLDHGHSKKTKKPKGNKQNDDTSETVTLIQVIEKWRTRKQNRD